MPATLRLTHKAVGAEVRRGTYDVVVDGTRVGSVELNETLETPVEAGRHTLQVLNGRNSSRTKTFDVADGETASFRCSGKSPLPIFLLSFALPSLALSLHRD
jgi:predicted transcriptional regulator